MHTRSGECSQTEGSLSYSRLLELFLEKIRSLGMDPTCLGCTVSGVVVPQQLLTPGCMIDYSSSMGGGHHSQQNMCMHEKDSAESHLEVSKN